MGQLYQVPSHKFEAVLFQQTKIKHTPDPSKQKVGSANVKQLGYVSRVKAVHI